jgi:hypothetical protein
MYAAATKDVPAFWKPFALEACKAVPVRVLAWLGAKALTEPATIRERMAMDRRNAMVKLFEDNY